MSRSEYSGLKCMGFDMYPCDYNAVFKAQWVKSHALGVLAHVGIGGSYSGLKELMHALDVLVCMFGWREVFCCLESGIFQTVMKVRGKTCGLLTHDLCTHDSISFGFVLISNDPFKPQFCTCHDS